MTKTATIALDVTKDVPIPPVNLGDVQFAAFAGIRLTITAPGGSVGSPPVERKVTWVVGNMVEGATYRLKIESVDVEGRVIDAIAEHDLVVPPAGTYWKLNGYSVAWS